MMSSVDENGHAARERYFALLAPLALLALVAILHGDALGEWWKTDDPQIVLHAIRNTPAETLFAPAKWRTLSIGFTPMVTLSFDLDLSLGGIRPAVFYAHQLLAIAAAVLLLFVLLEPLCGRWIALLTAAAAAASPAMALAAESLMIRHYVEGLALACAALVVWRLRPKESFAAARDGGAALLYLLAALAKEVYAPLPLLFLADGLVRRVPLRRLAARIVPSAVAAIVYLAWRRWMLGSFGGYGAEASFADLPASAWRAYRALFAAAPPLVAIGTPLLTIGAISALVVRARRLAWCGAGVPPPPGRGSGTRPEGGRDARTTPVPRAPGIIIVGALAIVVLLPFSGVAGLAEARYGFIPVIAAAALGGLGLATLPRAAGLAGGAALLLLHGWAGIAFDRTTDRTDAYGRAEGVYVWTRPAASPVLLAGSPGWYLAGIRDLRKIAGGGVAPRFLLSIEGVVAGAAEPESVVRIEGEPPAPRRLDSATMLRVAQARSRLDASAPLALRVALRDLVVSWDLGPAGGASFTWLTVPEYDEYRIPPAGSLRIPAPMETQRFRILRELPDGRWTLSPVLVLPAEGKTIAWRRGDAGA